MLLVHKIELTPAHAQATCRPSYRAKSSRPDARTRAGDLLRQIVRRCPSRLELGSVRMEAPV